VVYGPSNELQSMSYFGVTEQRNHNN
jgi:hypothetical protein